MKKVSALKLDVDYLQEQCENNPIPAPLVCVHRDQLRLLLDGYKKKKGIILDDAINEVVSIVADIGNVAKQCYRDNISFADLFSIIEKVKAMKES